MFFSKIFMLSVVRSGVLVSGCCSFRLCC